MPAENCVVLRNDQTFRPADLPRLSPDQFRDEVIRSVAAGARIAALWAQPHDAACHVTAILACDSQGCLRVLGTTAAPEYVSLTAACPQAQWFEREMWERHGVVPAGHPWLKPVRFLGAASAPGVVPDRAAPPACGVMDHYFQVSGQETHEVAVGPVHAGIIEPGHFRFQCQGETVLHLEISLGYQHRGVERALVGGPYPRTLACIETLAGDTSIAHAISHCRAVEALSATYVSPRAQVIRGLALELERIANHVGDLGALAGDVAYLPTAAYCGRIRGDVLNATALLCGNRFGRGLVRPGGVTNDLDRDDVVELQRRMRAAAQDARVAIELLWSSPSVMARFEGTGALTCELAEHLGLVGVAARACGVHRDVRHDFPSGVFRYTQIPVSTWDSGDVFGRAYVRWLEVQRSLAFIQEQLESLPGGECLRPVGPLAPDRAVVALTEGWRGEVCHVVATDAAGRFATCQVVDPSVHNWFGLALAMRNQQISDFPLCNKSFNLSYCGHDL